MDKTRTGHGDYTVLTDASMKRRYIAGKLAGSDATSTHLTSLCSGLDTGAFAASRRVAKQISVTWRPGTGEKFSTDEYPVILDYDSGLFEHLSGHGFRQGFILTVRPSTGQFPLPSVIETEQYRHTRAFSGIDDRFHRTWTCVVSRLFVNHEPWFSGPTPNQLEAGWDLTHWMHDHAEELGVEYLIWQGKIWSVGSDKDGWRDYDGGGMHSPEDITGGHYDHLHITVKE